jgi:hypothetical protein
MPTPNTAFQPSSGFAAAKNSGRKFGLIREASHAEQLKGYLAEIKFAAAFQYLGFDVEVAIGDYAGTVGRYTANGCSRRESDSDVSHLLQSARPCVAKKR